jgi:hypothetical protein
MRSHAVLLKTRSKPPSCGFRVALVYRWSFSLQDEFCGHFGSRSLYFFGCKRIFLLLFPLRSPQISERAFPLAVGSPASRLFALLVSWNLS